MALSGGHSDSRSAAVDRGSARHKTFERTDISVANVLSTAHILNLSETGALVHSTAAVSRTTFVVLTVAGREIPGEVMWVDGQRFGMKFDRRLAPDMIEAMLQA